MFHAIRTVLTYQVPVSFPRSLSSNFGRETCSVVRFCTQPDHSESTQKMEQAKKTSEETNKHGDVMSHSFGEGYATRSDEEGFGGTYSRSQTLPNTETDKIVHENDPAYDKTQGSEVKEKEKARHQTKASA